MTADSPERTGRQLWLVPREGEAGHHRVAEVAVNAPTARLQTYAIPDDLAASIAPGVTVRVPFGRHDRPVDGLCLRVSERPWDHTRRPVLEVLRTGTPLPADLVDLGLWVSDYYLATPWRTFTAILPAFVREPPTRKTTFVRTTGRSLDKPPTARQAALLAVLDAAGKPRQAALDAAGVTAATLASLRRHGVVETYTERVRIDPPLPDTVRTGRAHCPEDDFALTGAQQTALEHICAAVDAADAFRVFLLFGAPGSGKTEVYVRAIRHAIAHGQQALLLIPEIALATQIVERLARRFDRVAVMHSQLSNRQRRDTAAAIAAGQVDVVIGTRAAVFAPCPNPGLFVVDEEQEGSFKNLAAPFYHARDVAIKRGQLRRIPVVLGSATPALETWHNARHRPHYALLRLPERVGSAQLPTVITAARTEDDDPGGILSNRLRAELQDALQRGEQAILLHNRRGYAVQLRCSACGQALVCERCTARLIYHQSDNLLKCHRCGWQMAAPTTCPDDSCHGRLEKAGAAIQKLEEELHRIVPSARLLRLDSDTMRKREQYEAALSHFEQGAADIMLGTQMVAKGLDFPQVRLVGVIDADAALTLPDFRASERVFQLVVQVIGRAGRRDGASLALVQTQHAPPREIQHARAFAYEMFAAEELAARQQFFYPPFARMVRLVCADARPGRAKQAAAELAAGLRPLAGRIHARLRVEDAEACAITRLREMLRYQVLLRGPRDDSVHRLLAAARTEKRLHPRVQRFTIDVDPIDLL